MTRQSEIESRKYLILLICTNTSDTGLIHQELAKITFPCQILECHQKSEFLEILAGQHPDMILADYSHPDYPGLSSLKDAQSHQSEVPFIYLSPDISAELIIEALRQGATDVVMKNQLYKLNPLIERALTDKENRVERMKAQLSFLEIRQRLTEIINYLPDATFILNKEKKVIAWNRALEVMTGILKEEMLGKGEFQYMLPFYGKPCPALLDMIDNPSPDILSRYEYTKRGTDIIYAEAYIPRLNQGKGAYIWITASKLHNSNGQLAGYIESVRDIGISKKTELELFQTNQMMAALIQGAPVAIITINPDKKIMLWNPAAEQIFGWTSDEVIGKPVPFIPANHREEFLHNLDSVFQGNPATPLEVTCLHKNGSMIDLVFHSAAIKDTQGAIIGVLEIFEDVSEIRKLEQQFRQLQKMDAIGRLAGGIAHDFNNLMTAISGYAQIASAYLIPGHPLSEPVLEIEKAVERANQLTRQLLAFSSTQPGESKNISINKIIHNMDKLIHRLIGENIKVIIRLGTIPGYIKVDAGHFEQVVMNLAINARDAMPDGGELHIETYHQPAVNEQGNPASPLPPVEYAVLTIRDTGTGMTDEVRSHIFEPFYTTKEKGHGTGLGLATVYGIISQYKGSIEVLSTPGNGTTFQIKLPLYTESPPEITVLAEPSTGMPQGTETVMIIEDEDTVLHLNAKVLKRLGYSVITATTGKEALQAAAQVSPGNLQLILSDVILPDMNGVKLVEDIRQSHPNVKIILTSGYTDVAIMQRYQIHPSISFLPKPYTPTLLANRVRDILDKNKSPK